MPALHATPVALHSAALPAHPQPGRVQAHSAQAAGKAPTGPKKPARGLREVTVKAGDTVYSIARAQHSSVAAIAKANPKVEFRRLLAGTVLHVPVPAAKPTDPHAKKSAPKGHAKKKPTSSAGAKKGSRGAPHAPKPSHVVTYAGTEAARAYPAHVVASGDKHRRQLAAADLPTREQIHTMIVATAKRYGVDPTLALAIGWQESGHQQSAVSVCDALGTMQVMPSTGSWASSIVKHKLNLMQAQDNITAGVVTLRYLTQHAADQDQVIGAYYQGLAAVKAHGFYSDTRQYVASVHAHMKRFS